MAKAKTFRDLKVAYRVYSDVGVPLSTWCPSISKLEAYADQDDPGLKDVSPKRRNLMRLSMRGRNWGAMGTFYSTCQMSDKARAAKAKEKVYRAEYSTERKKSRKK